MDFQITKYMLKTSNYVIQTDTAATISDYSLSYICDSKDLTDHYHHCFKVAFSLDNYFDCLVDNVLVSNLKGIIIKEDIPHSFVTPGVNIVLNFIKSGTVHGNQLSDLLDGADWLDINQVLGNFNEIEILPDHYKNLPPDELISRINKFLDSICFVVQGKKAEGDARIKLALELIDQNLHKDLVIEQVAEKIHLSAERARHIFAQEVGIPMAQYILWKRIRNTIKLAAQAQESFTNACLKSGFGDQSHFNRAFRRIFLLRPLPIIRHCKVII